MAIAAWKRLERTPGYQRKKLFLKRLVGRELRLAPEIELTSVKAGGWWYHPDVLGTHSIVYSLGIGEDLDFDLSLIRQFGLTVHAFDPTPSTVSWLAAQDLPRDFHYHPLAVTAESGELILYPRINKNGSQSDIMYTMLQGSAAADDGVKVPSLNLRDLVAKLGHDRIDLLKMDIEGAEYDVLDVLPDLAVRPTQLLVEFHHRFAGVGLQKTVDMLDRLRNCGYRIFAISETGREVSFIQANSQ